MGYHALFQGIFPIQGLNSNLLCFLNWQAGSPTTSTTWEALITPSSSLLTCQSFTDLLLVSEYTSFLLWTLLWVFILLWRLPCTCKNSIRCVHFSPVNLCQFNFLTQSGILKELKKIFLPLVLLLRGSVLKKKKLCIWLTWLLVAHAESLAATCKLLVVARGIYSPDQELNPGPPHWKYSLNHWSTREVSRAQS